ncbi:MAG: S1C family serine protease [Actinomycetes bacterium]
MADDDRPGGGSGGAPEDYRYFGPWSAAPDPAPVPFQPYLPAPAPPPAPGPPRRGLATALVAGATALVVGGAAGFAGALLAGRSDATTAAPSPAATAGPSTPGSAPSRPGLRAPHDMDTVAVAEAVLPSTVMIRVLRGSSGSTGSGFVFDDAGHIVTNNHVVAAAAGGARLQVVYADGARSSATLVGRSPSYDLAVIRVERKNLEPLPLGNSDRAQVGQDVIAVGAPLGLPGTVTEGIVSATNRPVVVNEDSNADSPTAYINAIQTDAPINPGNSGGPLIDAAGQVVGVNSAILSLSTDADQAGNIGLGFAIPVNQARQIAELLIADGKATYPVIGANVASADNQVGVRLSEVEGRGPAARAGLKEGDVVTRIDGQRVDAIEELIVAIRTHRPGDVVTLDYRRGGATASARVTLGGREG